MKQFFETKFFRSFLPFMVLILGGSFIVKEFQAVRYKYREDISDSFVEEAKKLGVKLKKSTTLEEEYEKIKKLDIDNWENVRIPRPSEDPNSISN